MKLSTILEPINLVELYFCPDDISFQETSFTCHWKTLPYIPVHLFKNRMDQSVVEYCYRDMVYSYDQTNDSQRVYQKQWVSDEADRKMYTVCYQEESLPTHRFPCTNEIYEKREIYRVHYKINNRMFFIIEKENDAWTMYLRYSHANNVEMDKMEEDWQQAIKMLQKNIFK